MNMPLYKLQMNILFKTVICLILIGYTYRISAQEIKVTEFRSEPRDISARENVVFDANGDPCSLIKARCGLDDLNFESDLGIQKIEIKEGEYWIWVPPGTNRLTVSMNDSLKYNFDLPQFTEEYKVYVVVVNVVLPATTKYKDVPKISFISKPFGSKIYLDNVYYGDTPLDVNYIFDTLNIRIEKKKYETIFSETVNTGQSQELTFNLIRDPLATRFFMSITVDLFNYEILNPGISFGWLGKFGIYFMIRPQLFNLNADYDLIDPVSSTSVFYKENFIDYRFFIKKTEIFIGVSKRISNNAFLSLGYGYCYHDIIERVTNNSALSQSSKKKFTIADFSNSDIGGSGLDLELFYRFWNKMLINIQSTWFIKDSYYQGITGRSKSSIDIKFGIGYSF